MPDNASLTIFCDACPEGMGFWYLSMKIGFFSPTPAYENHDLIFYFKALCVPTYNHLLIAAVDIVLAGDHNLRVLHVPGLENQVADALSRSNFEFTLKLVPGLKIVPFKPWAWSPNSEGSINFQPPQRTLGAYEL